MLRESKEVMDKLVAAGYSNLELIACSSPSELAKDTGLPLEKAEEIVEKARKLSSFGFQTAYDLLKKQVKGRRLISTGSRNVDEILGGGVETGGITEIYGEYGCGKTQMAMQLSVNVQLPPEKGGLTGKAIYIDTEGTFKADRLKRMAVAVGLNPEVALKNVYYARAFSTDHQFILTREALKLVSKENVRLLVVDSLMALFRMEYVGREMLFQRQQKLKEYLSLLQRIASYHDVAVVVTNHVIERPEGSLLEVVRAAGGHVLSHAPLAILYVRKATGNKRIIRVVDSPHLPEREAVFVITDDGIRDP
ncbi:MAG: DNA repair and recombination protein RadA [Thermoprotei archaeon]|nr:MAG: DNA repair and recombination protein RadA [Thermoprotei archaeon]